MNGKSPASSRYRWLVRVLEGFLWTGLLVSCVATVLMVWGGTPAAVRLMEPQGGLWWRWLALFYVAASVSVGSGLAALAAVLRKPVLARLALQLSSAGIVGLTLGLNWQTLGRVFVSRGDSSVGWTAILTIAMALGGLVLLALGVLWSRAWVPRVVVLAAFVLCWSALTGSVEDDARLAPGFARAASSSDQRLLVIGLDGADWDYLEPLMDRGDLPNLKTLRDSGAWGDLETIRPTRSAPIWTSVVTGVEPRRHGVVNNSVERLRGSFRRLPKSLPKPRGLGVDWVVKLLRQSGRISQSSVASFDRRVPTFWTMATVNESPVDFVNWWATWPAEQILGRMVSDRVHFWRSVAKGFSVEDGHVTYPESLMSDLSRLIMRPDQVTLKHARQFMEVDEAEFEAMKTTPYRHHRLKSEFKYLFSMYMSNLKIALELIETGKRGDGPSPDLFVLFRIIDQASHQALEYSELADDHLQSTRLEIAKYGQVVSEAYRSADLAVGKLVEAFGAGNIVILSDHGFRLMRPRSRYKAYGHSGPSTPDGIFIAAGEAFRPGRVEGLGIYDMMPLFLHLKGWPVAVDFARGVPTQVFRESFMKSHPVQTIDSYGSMTVSLPEEGELIADDEMVERLRALGYID